MKHLSPFVLFFAWLLVPLFACARGEVTFEVVVIHATKSGKGVDAALQQYKTPLVRSFKDYSSFNKLDKKVFRLAPSKKHSVKLPNGHGNATFAYNQANGKHHSVKLAIPKAGVEADLRMPLNKPFFQAGLRYKNGILIVAFRLSE